MAEHHARLNAKTNKNKPGSDRREQRVFVVLPPPNRIAEGNKKGVWCWMLGVRLNYLKIRLEIHYSSLTIFINN